MDSGGAGLAYENRATDNGVFSWLLGCNANGFYCMMVYTGQARADDEPLNPQKAFALEKGCNYERMRELASAKGLTDWDIQLLKGRYCDGLSWRDMCDTFSNIGSERTIKRYVAAAARKFNGA